MFNILKEDGYTKVVVEGRNPSSGEIIQIKAAKVPSFKAGKGLKDAVNHR